jgi:hypothetical protein
VTAAPLVFRSTCDFPNGVAVFFTKGLVDTISNSFDVVFGTGEEFSVAEVDGDEPVKTDVGIDVLHGDDIVVPEVPFVLRFTSKLDFGADVLGGGETPLENGGFPNCVDGCFTKGLVDAISNSFEVAFGASEESSVTAGDGDDPVNTDAGIDLLNGDDTDLGYNDVRGETMFGVAAISDIVDVSDARLGFVVAVTASGVPSALTVPLASSRTSKLDFGAEVLGGGEACPANGADDRGDFPNGVADVLTKGLVRAMAIGVDEAFGKGEVSFVAEVKGDEPVLMDVGKPFLNGDDTVVAYNDARGESLFGREALRNVAATVDVTLVEVIATTTSRVFLCPMGKLPNLKESIGGGYTGGFC